MNVKGSVFIDLVRMIKKDKSGVYDKYLTSKDREIISAKMWSSGWYSYETYKHCLEAIFEVIAKNDLKVAKEWGRRTFEAVMASTYKGLLKCSDPFSFIKQFETINRSIYDFGNTEIVAEGENRALYKLSSFDAKFVLLYYIIQGWTERGMELSGAKNIKSEFVTESWEGHPFTSMRFTWTLQKLGILGDSPGKFYSFKEEKVFDALDQLAAMTSHVPNKREQMVRYYGHYSNAFRGLR